MGFSRSRGINWILTLGIIFSLIFAAVSFGFLCFFYTSRSIVENEICSTKMLNKFEVDKQTSKTSHSFVSLGKKFNADEFISFESSNGNNILISKIGTQRYSCTGTCYCKEQENRRSAFALSRSVTYLLVAASSAIAYGMGKKHLQEKCENMYSHSCSSNSLEIDDFSCSNLKSVSFSDDKSVRISKKKVAQEVEEDDDNYEHTFNCYGKCLDPIWPEGRTIHRQRLRDNIKSLRCNDHRTEEAIFEIFGPEVSQQEKYRIARKKFLVEHMNIYCDTRMLIDPETSEVVKCVAYYDDGEGLVDCEQIDPPPDENVCRIS